MNYDLKIGAIEYKNIDDPHQFDHPPVSRELSSQGKIAAGDTFIYLLFFFTF